MDSPLDKERYNNAEANLKHLISTPSISGNEAGCADIMCNYLLNRGVNVIRTGNNVIALSKRYNDEKKTLMLNSHLDTVRACKGYTFDPFVPVEDNDKIAGLGSNDAGASVVSLTEAFLYFEEHDIIDFNLVLVLSAEEENSGERGIALALAVAPEIDCAIIGEPTDMKVAEAERGLLVVDATANGKSGHAAREEGMNAINVAVADIILLNNFNFDRVSPTMGRVKCTVTQINAGTQHNVIPDSCRFVIDIRTTDLYSNGEIMEILAGNMKSDLKARSLQNKSSSVPAGHPLLICAGKLGIDKYVSPTTSDWMRIPFPAVKFGPGNSARSHMADEYILKKELSNGIDTYIEFIGNLKL